VTYVVSGKRTGRIHFVPITPHAIRPRRPGEGRDPERHFPQCRVMRWTAALPESGQLGLLPVHETKSVRMNQDAQERLACVGRHARRRSEIRR
jgi:hypothetical protein